MSKEKRSGKIFIDYLRNHMGATAIGAYSTRARENATIATPISWEELSVKLKSDHFTLRNLPDRLGKIKSDPWKDFFKLKQTLPSI
jgi:bifunctional non-homologous end joining protein LigD